MRNSVVLAVILASLSLCMPHGSLADPAPIHLPLDLRLTPPQIQASDSNWQVLSHSISCAEFHPSRYPVSEWEDAVLGMKAGGADAVAFYCFWLHHEETEGELDFKGNRNLRAFVELCAKHEMPVLARLGPWCHGEARNGGYPDWFRAKTGKHYLKLDERSRPDIERWYRALAAQFKGLLAKDGGPSIGIQLDNEVQIGNSEPSVGAQFLVDLDQLARDVGFDVPLRTATGWSGPVPEPLTPVFSSYADAPWKRTSRRLPPNRRYVFRLDRAPSIAAELGIVNPPTSEDYSLVFPTPTFIGEMGAGQQITYHRRPVIAPQDAAAMVITHLGVGANIIGYYTYHGTQHPLSRNGEYSTQESKATGYWNDYPLISYDFQCPLSEWGILRPSFHELKMIHLFMKDFGQDLAPMLPVLPAGRATKPDDLKTMRWSVRNSGKSGFLFFNNHVRQFDMPEFEDVEIELRWPKVGDERGKIAAETAPPTLNGSAVDPVRGQLTPKFNLKNHAYAILPFNMDLDGIRLHSATAQPLCRIEGDVPTYVFFAPEGISPSTFVFDKSLTLSPAQQGVDAADRRRQPRREPASYNVAPGLNSGFTIPTPGGGSIRILTLSVDQPRIAYKTTIGGRETLALCKHLLLSQLDGTIDIRVVGDDALDLWLYPSATLNGLPAGKPDGLFQHHRFTFLAFNPPDVTFRQRPAAPGKKVRIWPSCTHRHKVIDGCKDYEITVPATIRDGVHDVLLELNYAGDTAALYSDGIIVADDYYYGRAMPVGTKRLGKRLTDAEVILQLRPLSPKVRRATFFEASTNLDFVSEGRCELRSITPIPIRRVLLTPK